MTSGGFVYIVSNDANNVLYIGVTSDLYSKILEHKEKKYRTSFSAQYNGNKLV